ncbi:14 kDa proline-rich protein DC2.15-like protein [Corchorus olitorius]|uniref:14 kDa proline-rich protein DC2.15-like protein n=1 Tax=Corchorus olitorius TaxID=93759 RepID=A0A1R3G2Z4_9ROSI|nr:14 kDa proline-rich protein DC2.15-like protein [Corchorus olitorius]
MASSSKASAPIAFLLALNLVFFTLVSSQTPSPPPPPPSACPASISSLGTCSSLLNLVLIATLAVGNNTASPCCRALNLLGANVRACICQELVEQVQILLRFQAINVTVGSTVNLTVPVNAMVNTCNLAGPIVGSGDCMITI